MERFDSTYNFVRCFFGKNIFCWLNVFSYHFDFFLLKLSSQNNTFYFPYFVIFHYEVEGEFFCFCNIYEIE
jgi:hypothetical protein